jgi:hypothetical protein
MDTRRVKTGHFGKTPPRVFSDFDWVRDHKKELLAKYGEGSIIVFEQQVLGFGKTYDEALDDAERNLPPEVTEVTAIHAMIHYPQPFASMLLRRKE